MTVINTLPHDINIVRDCVFDSKIRKYIGHKIDYTYPSVLKDENSPYKVLNAKIDTVYDQTIDNIPIFIKKIVDCDTFPSVNDDDIVIVSALYASAFYHKFGYYPPQMYLVADPVMNMNDTSKFLGCRGLTKPF